MADDPKTHEPNQHGSVNPETEPKQDIPGVEEKRKPGRPPKAATHAFVDNTSTQYTPSPERNDIDQAKQPTGTKGKGVAGWGDFDESDLQETEGEWRDERVSGRMAGLVAKENDSPPPIPAPDKGEPLFPVRMLRNYRPASDRWYPILTNGKLGKRPPVEDGASPKIQKGYFVALPQSEAVQLVKRGLAERQDALPE